MLSKINSFLVGILVAVCIFYCSDTFYSIYRQSSKDPKNLEVVKVAEQREVVVIKAGLEPNFINLWRIFK